jgi:hypothetical protein
MSRSIATLVSPVALLGLAALLCAGCMPGMTPAQRVQDAASDYATAVRFGRMDVAAGQVGRDAHDAFVRQHASWGTNVRVLDCELTALRLRSKDRAEVMLSVSWQRIDESETRITQVAQRWHDDGGWRLENEERARGDVGLLGEPSAVVAAPAAPAQFRTITIR